MAGRGSVRDRRLAAVAAVLFAGLLVVTMRLVVVQGLQAGRYSELAREQRDQSIKIAPRRGTILDREGEVLAISEDVTTIYATPYQVKKHARTASRIADVLGEDPGDVEEKLRQRSGFVYIARKVDDKRANMLKKMRLEGIGFIEDSKRFYPYGSLASQVLGVVDVDNNGQSGLELQYQDLLGGKQGDVLLERDAAGVPIPGSEKRNIPAVDGADLQLTIDKDIQDFTEKALSDAMESYCAKSATALVIECNTGDILGMASAPTFDPNDRDSLDPASMRNRAVTDIYEPGSAFKILTASAALEEGLVEPGTVMTVPAQLDIYGEIFKDAEPKPTRQMDFTQVISQSSNVGTIMAGTQLGGKRLSEYIERFGLGRPTGVDFPGEVAGIVPPLSKWSGTSVATISIGQGISMTPLQLACVAAEIANGGRKVTPHFLEARVTDGGIKDAGLGGVGDEVLSRETCQEMAGILIQVLAPGGTGVRAGVRYYSVAGKTGTASKPAPGGAGYGGGYMATFVGFAPAERPRIVCLVVLDEPSPIWGGETAAPVFGQVMGFSLQHLRIPTSWGSAQEPAVEGEAVERD